MGEITPKCAGCDRLCTPLDPLCKSCVNQNHYKVRPHDFGMEREMNMLGITPPRSGKNLFISTASYYGDGLLEKMRRQYVDTPDSCIPTVYQLDRTSLYPSPEWVKARCLNDIFRKREAKMKLPRIEKVIFNDPATIVIWRDGTKTVVKAENELFDPEKGLAMAISKKALGNQGNYYEKFKKWLPEANK